MGINIRDLARMANTSVATVSRALSGKAGVSEEKRRNIIQLAEELRFRPNRLAQNLSCQKSRVIGMIASTLENPTYLHYYQIIEEYFKPRGYQLLIADSKFDLEKEQENIATMLEHRAEGLIIFPVADWHHNHEISHFLELKLKKIPFVLLGKVAGYNFDCAFAEEVDSAYQIGRHLIDLGHRTIAVVSYERQNRPARERLEGLQKAFIDAKLAVDEATLNRRIRLLDRVSDEQVHAQMVELFTGPETPTALAPVSDAVALRLYRPLRELGLRIPEDISIATFGDSLYSRFLMPALTLMATDDQGVALAAAEILDHRIADPDGPAVMRSVMQKFIERESTAAPGGNHPPAGERVRPRRATRNKVNV